MGTHPERWAKLHRHFVPAYSSSALIALLITGDVRHDDHVIDRMPVRVGLSPGRDQRSDQRGALVASIKGRSHLEQAGRVDAIVFRQDRDVDRGRPVVTNIVLRHKRWSPSSAGLCRQLGIPRHPLAEAVTARRRAPISALHEECGVLVGLGMRTWAAGRTLLLGGQKSLRRKSWNCPRRRRVVNKLAASGDPAAARGGRHAGRLIGLRDARCVRAAGADEAAGQWDSPDRHAHRQPPGDRPGLSPTNWGLVGGAPRSCRRTSSRRCASCRTTAVVE